MLKLGVDIGGTKINIGIFDEAHTLLISKKYYIKDITHLPSFIEKSVHTLCEEGGLKFNDIISCGIGIPGTVSEDGKTIIKAPNISIIKDGICEELEKILSVPVRLIQDSRAAAWGEYLFGAGKGKDSVVCVTLGTGIGTGIVLNGNIYSGSLGCAGELGHLPAHENGRHCGCGKLGCLEKYCAGIGLDITASEILGEGKKCQDLFLAAEQGNSCALKVIDDAVKLLANALVAIINLLSPDCMLLSGGLSEQKGLYSEPLINYVKQRCYNVGKIPNIQLAILGELAPLYGAAHLPMENKRRKPRISASIMCADILNMGQELKDIEKSGIDYIHCDIMDNHFVPNLMLPMELINKLRGGTDLPFDIHIMADNPEGVLEKLVIKDGDIVSVHYESTVHLQRAITRIKELGAKVCVALNPATPIEMLTDVLGETDMILLMTVNPGFSGQALVEGSLDKIKRTRAMLDKNGYRHIPIEIDGNCSFENVPKMYEAGAEIFVAGTSSIFKKGQTVQEGTAKLLSLLP